MVLAAALAVLTLTHRGPDLAPDGHRRAAGSGERLRHTGAQASWSSWLPREDLQNAIALNSSMFNGARVVGPAVAGVLVAAVGEGWCSLPTR